MHLPSFFLSYLAIWQPLGFSLIFFGLLLEGDITLFTVAFLTREGLFNVSLILPFVLVSIFLGDIFWYFVGRDLVSKHPGVHRLVDRFARHFDRHLTDRPLKTLVFTKFVYGAHHAVLIRAGMSRMDFRRFLKYDMVSILVWVLVIGGLGLFSSLSLEYMRKYVRFVEVSLLFGLLAFFIFERILKLLSQRGLQDRE